MILVDGRATKACVLKTSKCAGKSIVTCEGLTPRERDVYAYAFTSCGAVQCGFCTPGMVMSAKGLLDAVPDPTRAQVKEALKNNICRCTGYKKIEEAVLLAAKLLREGTSAPACTFTGRVGENLPRVDAPAKTVGDAEYVDDMRVEGLCFGSAVRSAYPRARVLSIDATEARRCPASSPCSPPTTCPGTPRSAISRRITTCSSPSAGSPTFSGTRSRSSQPRTVRRSNGRRPSSGWNTRSCPASSPPPRRWPPARRSYTRKLPATCSPTSIWCAETPTRRSAAPNMW